MVKDKILDELQDEVAITDSTAYTLGGDDSTMNDEQTGNMSEPVYRYYCPACSGTAFQCANKAYFESECRSCHAALERDDNNYIQL